MDLFNSGFMEFIFDDDKNVKEAMNVANTLKECVSGDADVSAEIGDSHLVRSINVTVKGSHIEIKDPKKFSDATRGTDVMDICPMPRGEVEMTFSYNYTRGADE